MPEKEPTPPRLIISETANDEQKAALRLFNFIAVASYPNAEILDDSIRVILALGAHKKAMFDDSTDEILDNDPTMNNLVLKRQNAITEDAKTETWRQLVTHQFTLVAGRLALENTVELNLPDKTIKPKDVEQNAS